MYRIEFIADYKELCRFIETANTYKYEILSVVSKYNESYIIIYKEENNV